MPKKTFEQAAESGHGVLIQLKDNQQTLLEDVQCLAKNQLPCNTYKQKVEHNHGRITKRSVSIYQSNLCESILDDQWAAYIKTVIQVQRSTDVFDTKTKLYINRSETAWYLSNLSIPDPASWHRWILQHWGIENRNHYVRDVSLQEDASRIRKNPLNMATLRSTALNILRKNKVTNIKGQLYENSLQWCIVFSYPQVG